MFARSSIGTSLDNERSHAMKRLTETGYVRIHQILGNPKTGVPGVLPISRETFYSRIRRVSATDKARPAYLNVANRG